MQAGAVEQSREGAPDGGDHARIDQQELVVAADVGAVGEGERVVQAVAMGMADALGRAGRPGGVEDVGKVVRLRAWRLRAGRGLANLVQVQDGDLRREQSGGRLGQPARRRHQHCAGLAGDLQVALQRMIGVQRRHAPA